MNALYVCFLLMWRRNCSVFGVFVVILDFTVATKPGASFIQFYDHEFFLNQPFLCDMILRTICFYMACFSIQICTYMNIRFTPLQMFIL